VCECEHCADRFTGGEGRTNFSSQFHEAFSMKTLLMLGAVTVLSLSSPAFAQNTPGKKMPMPHGGMSPSSTAMDMSMMKNLGPADENYDLRFIDMMLMHHEGAITMAKDALEKSKRPEIQELAKSIIEAQQNEIDEMKVWRKTWYPK
jgi:uncharacterized protein (DUF305 family)